MADSLKPVEVPQSVLDGFNELPAATVFGAVSRLGSPRRVGWLRPGAHVPEQTANRKVNRPLRNLQ